MIEVSVRLDGITVTGHAGYAPNGQDIVCAAVSTLAYTLIYSIEALAADKIGYLIRDGDIEINYKNLSEKGKLLVDSFFIGIANLIEQYPDNVRLAS